MAEYKIQGETLTAIADAIRAKKYTTAIFTPGQMATEIAGIVTGDDLPDAEEVSFGTSENVTENVLSWNGTVNTNVQGTGGYTFRPTEDVAIYKVSFYQKKKRSTISTITLWDYNGTSLFSYTETTDSVGWHEITLPEPYNLKAGETYTITRFAVGDWNVMNYTVTWSTNKLTFMNYVFQGGSSEVLPTTSSTYLHLIDMAIGAPITESVVTEYKIQTMTMDELADAIREKAGVEQTISPAQMIAIVDAVNLNLQEKSVTPTEEVQEVTPDAGYYGLSKITVGAVGKSSGLLTIAEWKQSNITDSKYANDIYYANGTWVMATSGTGVYYSTDGKTWTKGTIGDLYLRSVCYGNGVWVTGTSNGVYYSTDGKSWTAGNVTGQCWGVRFANGIFVLCNSNSGIYYSTNGTTWTRSNATSSFSSVLYAGGLWVAAGYATGSTSAPGLYYSTDGKSWTASNVASGGGSSNNTNSLNYYNGHWVACMQNRGLYYSTDGKTWTQSNITSGTPYCAVYGDGLWVSGFYSTGLYYSTDGKTWTQSNVTNINCGSICFVDGVWVACSMNRKGIYYSVDGMTWMRGYNVTDDYEASPYYVDGVLVIGGDRNGIMYCEV